MGGIEGGEREKGRASKRSPTRHSGMKHLEKLEEKMINHVGIREKGLNKNKGCGATCGKGKRVQGAFMVGRGKDKKGRGDVR